MRYDIYFTFLAIFIVLRNIGCFFFPFFIRRNFLANKDRKFFIIKLFGTTTQYTWPVFYASILWLVLYYYENFYLLQEVLLFIKGVSN